MTIQHFLRVVMALFMLLGARVAEAQTGAFDAAILLPGAGEIRLDGTISAINTAQKRFSFKATSFSLPDGKSNLLSSPKTKVVLVDAKTLLRADGKESVSFNKLKVGDSVIVVGKDLGSGKALPARVVAIKGNANEKIVAPPVAAQGKKPIKKPLPPEPVVPIAAQTALETLGLRPELALQIGHSARIQAITFAPDGKIVASASWDKTVKLWRVGTRELLRTLIGHSDYVNAIAFSPDGAIVASGSGDQTVRVWSVETGQLLHILSGHTSSVLSVAFSADGRTLVSGSHDRTARLWNVENGALLRTFEGHDEQVVTVALSPDGQTLASGSIASARLWNSATGQQQHTIAGHVGALKSVAFSPGGKTLVTVDHRALKLWDARTGKLLRALLDPDEPDNPAMSSPPSFIAFAPDGKTLSSWSADGTVREWDAETGEIVRAQVVRGPARDTHTVAFSPDGSTMAFGDDDSSVKLRDLQKGKQGTLTGNQQQVSSASFSPDGKKLAAANVDHSVWLWNAQTGEILLTLKGHKNYVDAVVFSPDGKTLATGDWSGVITVNLWDVDTGKLLRTLTGNKTSNARVAIDFSPDSQTLASGAENGKVELWSVQTGELQRVLSAPAGAPVGDVLGVAFSPDGKWVAGGVWAVQSRVSVWNAQSGELRHTLDANVDRVLSVAFSPDGETVAAGGQDTVVRLWKMATGKLQHSLTGHGDWVEEIAFSRDGKQLASASRDSTIKLWDAGAGKLQKTLAGHGNGVNSVNFSTDGKRLVSGSQDGTLNVWRIPDGKLLATLLSLPSQGVEAQPDNVDAKDVQYIAVTPEGYYSGSPGADRYVRFRVGNTLYPAESFQAKYHRPDLVRKALSGVAGAAPSTPSTRFYPPLIEIVSPTNNSKVKENTIKVAMRITAEREIKRVEIFVNGARAKPITVDGKPIEIGAKAIEIGAKPIEVGAKDIPAAHKVAQQYIATIALPPNVSTIKLQAIAFDDGDLQSPREEVLFSREEGAPDKDAGKLLGLCVGVSRYQDAKLNLKFADADADELAKALNAQRGIYSAAQVQALTNEEATSAGVRAGLDKLVAQATRDDTVFVLLSGHGWRSDDRTFYFATHETDRQNITKSALPWRDVVSRLAKLSEKSKRVIVLLDACHSGSAATNEELVKAVLSANAGVMVFASSKGSEVSLELTTEKHGAFTKAILEGIEGRGNEGAERELTLWDFASYVRKRVKQLTEGAQNPQVPFLQDFDTDAAIVSKDV